MTLQKNCSKCGQDYAGDTSICPEDGFPLVLVKAADISEIEMGTRYEFLELLGQGGMGAVYKARHTIMERTVAIKLLLADISKDPQAMMRFQVEARAASILSHPHIVTIFEFDFTKNGLPFLVMEYLPGETLQQALQQRKNLPWQLTVPIFLQICDAVSHAHLRNVVHRDLKPSNVMLTTDDAHRSQVKLLDFGIAKLFAAPGKTAMRLTKTGELFGSPLYMSPEQCMGQSIDARADIYSLGCMMYETLSGVAPVSGKNLLALVYAHLHDEPKPLAKVSPEIVIAEELEAIVHKAMKKDPADRYESVRDLLTALEKFYFDRMPAAGLERGGIVAGGTIGSPGTQGSGSSKGSGTQGSGSTQGSGGTYDFFTNACDESQGVEELAPQPSDKLNELEQRATAGDAEGQYELGCFYYEGAMLDRDLEKSFFWHSKAAAQKYVQSICWIGILYRDAQGVEQNYDQAIKYFQEGASLEDAQSQFFLAQMYESGRGVDLDFDMAAYWYRKSAQKDHVASMAALAKLYQSGTGVDANEKKAAQWFLKAAEKGDADSQNEMGKRYAAGNGVTQNLPKAASWYLCAAQQGQADAKVNVAHCYANGEGIPKDQKEALMWMTYAAQAGHPEAQNWLAYWYEEGLMGCDKNVKLALRWYSKAALKKDPWAQYKLGNFAEFGTAMPKNERQAVDWYRRAAEQGTRVAQLDLAHCYRNGWGVKQDEGQYLFWIEKAADNGSIEAMKELGREVASQEGSANASGRPRSHEHRHLPQTEELEEDDDVSDEDLEQDEHDQSLHKTIRHHLRQAKRGRGSDMMDLAFHYRCGDLVKKSEKRACYWFTRGAEAGDAESMLELGHIYLYGWGVEKDFAKSFELFQGAAEKGNKKGMTALGDAYAYGEGVGTDAEQAVFWYKKAAEKNYPEALKRLAGCCENGFGVEADLHEAAQWWLQAARKGDKHAQYWIGVCYREGMGVEVDHAEAATWLECSARQKYCLGKIELAKCYEEGIGVERNAEEAKQLLTEAAQDGCLTAQEKLKG